MYDADRSGTLRPSELGRLIRDMLPGVTRAELHYFLVRARGVVKSTWEEAPPAGMSMACMSMLGMVGA
jgi:hypothetical protein